MNSPIEPKIRVAFGAFEYWEKSIRQNLDARYIPAFVDLGRTRLSAFDAIIPLQLRHYAPLARHPRLRGTKFFAPSPAVVSLCDDKLRLTQFLLANGFAASVPPIRSFGPPYPYIRKKRRSWWGKDCHLVNGPQDERDLALNDPDWFAQDLVPGDLEFATHILRVGGQIRYVSTFIHTMPSPLSVNGAQDSPLHSTFFRGCHHLDLFSEILTALDFEGTACIDYKLAGGKPILFEINPRFGGSLCTDITTYLDAYLSALTPPSPQPRFSPKLTLSRLLARLR